MNRLKLLLFAALAVIPLGNPAKAAGPQKEDSPTRAEYLAEFEETCREGQEESEVLAVNDAKSRENKDAKLFRDTRSEQFGLVEELIDGLSLIQRPPGNWEELDALWASLNQYDESNGKTWELKDRYYEMAVKLGEEEILFSGEDAVHKELKAAQDAAFQAQDEEKAQGQKVGKAAQQLGLRECFAHLSTP